MFARYMFCSSKKKTQCETFNYIRMIFFLLFLFCIFARTVIIEQCDEIWLKRWNAMWLFDTKLSMNLSILHVNSILKHCFVCLKVNIYEWIEWIRVFCVSGKCRFDVCLFKVWCIQNHIYEKKQVFWMLAGLTFAFKNHRRQLKYVCNLYVFRQWIQSNAYHEVKMMWCMKTT